MWGHQVRSVSGPQTGHVSLAMSVEPAMSVPSKAKQVFVQLSIACMLPRQDKQFLFATSWTHACDAQLDNSVNELGATCLVISGQQKRNKGEVHTSAPCF